MKLKKKKKKKKKSGSGVGVEVLPEGFSFTYWAGWLAHLGFSWVLYNIRNFFFFIQ